MEKSSPKDPGVAAALSFIFTGLGQLYNGQIFQGLVLIFFSTLWLLVFLVGALFLGMFLLGKNFLPGQVSLGVALMGVGILFIALFGIYSIVNAYKIAQDK